MYHLIDIYLEPGELNGGLKLSTLNCIGSRALRTLIGFGVLY